MSTATVEQVVTTAESTVAVRRFSWWGRATHAVLALSVFGLVLTGMPLRYPDAFWAQPLFLFWQTERGAVAVHKVCAVLFFGAGAMHLLALAYGFVTRRIKITKIFGPDSILPNPQDVRNISQHIRYLKGEAERPDYGRFAFWEKFDYLAEIWGLLVIGLSGLIMWFPSQAANYLPGWIVNAALIFHGYEAVLAMAFLFTVHFFNTHLRPEIFPVDPVDLHRGHPAARGPGALPRVVPAPRGDGRADGRGRHAVEDRVRHHAVLPDRRDRHHAAGDADGADRGRDLPDRDRRRLTL